MRLKKLHIASFRNIEQIDLAPGDRFNIVHGNNAQGKTNLLEAIYLLGTTKSFRHARNTELVKWGDTDGLVSGTVEKEGVSRSIALTINREGKKVRVDHKAVVRYTDFFGSLNVVVFSPDELGIVKGLPEIRRRYLDRAVFSGDETYLPVHHAYMKTLRHRNSLLKSGDTSSLEAWSEKVAESGAAVIRKRIAYLEEIVPLVAGFYLKIAGNSEVAALSYRPHLLRDSDLVGDVAAKLAEAMAKTAVEERRLQTTVVGPHRDDLAFLLNGKVAKHHASQGQQRSLVLALKMAEIEYLQRKFSHPPVFLLDDISSELDRDRNRNLMEFLKNMDMQVFISTTGLTTLALDGIDNYSTFHLQGGKVLH